MSSCRYAVSGGDGLHRRSTSPGRSLTFQVHHARPWGATDWVSLYTSVEVQPRTIAQSGEPKATTCAYPATWTPRVQFAGAVLQGTHPLALTLESTGSGNGATDRLS